MYDKLLVRVFSLAVLGLVGCKSLSKSGLQVEVTKLVKCKESQKAQNGDKVTVHYGGFLQDGKYQENIFRILIKIIKTSSTRFERL